MENSSEVLDRAVEDDEIDTQVQAVAVLLVMEIDLDRLELVDWEEGDAGGRKKKRQEGGARLWAGSVVDCYSFPFSAILVNNLRDGDYPRSFFSLLRSSSLPSSSSSFLQ